MKTYTKEQIEILSKNPNIKLVTEDRLELTFEFRVELYDKWEKNPENSTIRKILEEHGFDKKNPGRVFIKNLARNIKRHGKPSNIIRT